MKFQSLALVVTISLISSCASYVQDTQKIRSRFLEGSYQKAYEEIESSGLKKESNSRLLYLLEKATILSKLGTEDPKKREQSRKTFIEADKLVDELYTTSISKTAATFVVNDRMSDYEGEDYEKIAIHTMLALSFIEEENYKSAIIEARKINNRLHEISQKYDSRYRKYSEDAFARYLSALIYEKQKQFDDAIIDYKKALSIYEQSGYHKFYRGAVLDGVVKGLYALAKKRNRKEIIKELKESYSDYISAWHERNDKIKNSGEVVVIHEVGSIALKINKEFVFNWDKQVVRFSFPYIPKERHHKKGKTGIEWKEGQFADGENVADMNAIAHFSLEDRRGRLMLKSAARLLLKGQMTMRAEKEFGPLGGLAANVFSAVTETADTRGWTLLPEAFYVTRLRLPAGEHSLKIYSNGRLQEIKKVVVTPQNMVILRANLS